MRLELFSAAFTLRCAAITQTVVVSGAGSDPDQFLRERTRDVLATYPGHRLIGRTVITLTDAIAAAAGYHRTA